MDYIINLSESDYILKKPEDFKQFLYENKGRNFVKSHGYCNEIIVLTRLLAISQDCGQSCKIVKICEKFVKTEL